MCVQPKNFKTKAKNPMGVGLAGWLKGKEISHETILFFVTIMFSACVTPNPKPNRG